MVKELTYYPNDQNNEQGSRNIQPPRELLLKVRLLILQHPWFVERRACKVRKRSITEGRILIRFVELAWLVSRVDKNVFDLVNHFI